MGSGASSHSNPPTETEPAPDLSISPTSTPATSPPPSSVTSPSSPSLVVSASANSIAGGYKEKTVDPFAISEMLQHTPRREQSLLETPRTPREVGISPKFTTERTPRTGGGSLTLDPSIDPKEDAAANIYRQVDRENRTEGIAKDEKQDDRSISESMLVVKEVPPAPGDPETASFESVGGSKGNLPFGTAKIHKRKKKTKPAIVSQSNFPIVTYENGSSMDHLEGKDDDAINGQYLEVEEEEVEEFIILNLPKDDLPHPTLPLGPPSQCVQDSFASKRFLEGLEGLKQRWGEVQFLLKTPIDSVEKFDLVHQTSHQSIVFLEEIGAIAKEYGVLQGALSQWLMPFDANTSASDQTNIYRLRTGKWDTFGSQLNFGEEKRIEMIKKLIDVRKLVKVKIADDNDLDLAKRTVVDIDAVCRLLKLEAAKREGDAAMTPFELLTKELEL